MKTSLKILSAVISFAVCSAVPLSRAADATAPAPKKAHSPQEQTAKLDKAVNRLQEQLEPLNLTDEQKARVDAIIQEEEKAAVELRKDKGAAKEDRKAKVQELRATTLAKIRAVLTPEQAAKFGKHGKGKGKGRAGDKAEDKAESAVTP